MDITAHMDEEEQFLFAQFVDAYLECAFWAEKPDDADETWTNEVAFSPEALAHAEASCFLFWNEAAHIIRREVQQAGHDFWLTRRGHGSGFWDGDWPETERKCLTGLSEKAGDVDLYQGDDGKLYFS